MLYAQRVLWMNRPSDVDHQINDARRYIELKQDILASAHTEGDIKDCQMVLGVALQTYKKLVENRNKLKKHFYRVSSEEKELA